MPMTKNDLEGFKAKLLDLRAELLRQLDVSKKEVTSGTDSSSFQSQHPGEAASDVAQQSTNISLSSNDLEMLKQIDHALERIKEGTYGICEDSGVKIPRKRLEYFPLATRTIEAQKKFEQEKPFKDLY